MDTEFVNEYIARLNSNLQELMNKCILLETKLAVANKVSSKLQEDLNAAEAKIAKLEEASKKTKPSSV